MSQRTRARTTGGDALKLSKTSKTSKTAKKDSSELATLSPQTLARTLRAVAAELERDPELAWRINEAVTSSGSGEEALSTPYVRSPAPAAAPAPTVDSAPTFRPRLITGASPDLGPGIPNPFTLVANRGEKGLRAVLLELRLGTLRAIIREHGLDPRGTLTRQNDAAKLRAFILEAVTRPNP